jgi:hypothetical protein
MHELRCSACQELFATYAIEGDKISLGTVNDQSFEIRFFGLAGTILECLKCSARTPIAVFDEMTTRAVV